MKHWRMSMMKAAAMLLAFWGLLATPAMAAATGPNENARQFTFVWMTDTQGLTGRYLPTYKAMTKWIVDNRDKLNIRYVFHTGDIVQVGKNARQWQNVSDAMSALDGVVPYGVLPGNHDKCKASANYREFFGEKRFAGNAAFGGGYKDNWGHYDLIQCGAKKFIMLYLGYGIDEEGIRWANGALQRYSEYTAFVCSHSYLGTNAKYTGVGRALFDKVVKPNANVAYVLCGHAHGFASLKTDIIEGNKTRSVYQMLANYQSKKQGGGGRMRVMTLDTEKNTISVRTFSPLMDVDEQALILPLR